MRIQGVQGVVAGLCLGLALSTARAGDDAGGGDLRSAPPSGGVWFGGAFSRKDPKPDPNKPLVPESSTRATANDPATMQSREMDAYLRRLGACLRLQQIALEKGDDAMLDRAEQLAKLAAVVYQKRTGGQPALSEEQNLTRELRPTGDAGRTASLREVNR